MSKLGIIFDMDGTLWDSADGVAKSWTKVVYGRYPKKLLITEADVKGVMGMTMDKIADMLFPLLKKDERMELLDECCAEENDYLCKHGGILYPKLEETLKLLKEKYHLYIVSNCQSGYIEAFLDYYGFEDYFEDIECYGNNELPKGDNIRLVVTRNGLDDACYVGDIQGDFNASLEAGVKFIHAAYGFGTIDRKVPEISCLSELPEAVEKVFACVFEL